VGHLVGHLWHFMEFNNHWKNSVSTHNARTNSGVVRKCPTGDMIPRSPFVSTKDISRLCSDLQNSNLRAREEDYRLLIMEYFG